MKINKTYFAFGSLTMAFFMWGLVTSLNDILIPHLKEMFNLNYTQAMLIQFVFFMAYVIFSIPASKVLNKFGYRWTIVTGFVVAGIGCLGFWPAAGYAVYSYFLASLFILAMGVVTLQVAANPYISLLGDKKTASARLTFAQGLNSLGTTVGPILGGIFILGAIKAAQASGDTAAIVKDIQMPYLVLAIIMFVLGLYFIIFPLPKLKGDIEHNYETTAAIEEIKHEKPIYICKNT